MLKKYLMTDAISDVRGTVLESSFSVSYQITKRNDDGTTTVTPKTVPATDILRTFETFWPTWGLVYDSSLTANGSLFAQTFTTYRLSNADNLSRTVSAYLADYNPLNNYQGREQTTRLGNGGHIDSTSTHDVPEYTDTTTDGNTRSGSETVSGGKQETRDDTASVTTFDSDVFGATDNTVGSTNTVNDSYTTTYNDVTDSGGGSVTHGAHLDTDTTTYTHYNALNGNADYSGGTDLFGNTVTGGDEYSNEVRTRAGNLGVTTSQQMITSELDLRTRDLLIDWLGVFISRYFIMSPVVREGETEWD